MWDFLEKTLRKTQQLLSLISFMRSFIFQLPTPVLQERSAVNRSARSTSMNVEGVWRHSGLIKVLKFLVLSAINAKQAMFFLHSSIKSALQFIKRVRVMSSSASQLQNWDPEGSFCLSKGIYPYLQTGKKKNLNSWLAGDIAVPITHAHIHTNLESPIKLTCLVLDCVETMTRGFKPVAFLLTTEKQQC